MTSIADNTAQKIVEILNKEPRATNKEIADTLGITEPTVANRMRQMMDSSQMRVTAQKHIFSDGYTLMWALFVNTTSRTVQAISKDIAKFEDVTSVTQGVGNPDIVVLGRSKGNADAFELMNQISLTRGVSSAESVICYAIHKYTSDTGDLLLPQGPGAIHDADDVNEQIFRAFFEDGRRSNREVGSKIGLTEAAVRQRVKKLLTKGEMQFQAVCHPAFRERGVIAVARIQTQAKYTETILKRLAGMETIPFMSEVSGKYNILAVLGAPTNAELGDFCDNTLLPMKGLNKLDIQIQVARTKAQFHLAYFEGRNFIPRRK